MTKDALIQSLIRALEPFAKVKSRIPENWPDACSLYWTTDQPDTGKPRYWYIGYHACYEPAGPKIRDYRRAAKAARMAERSHFGDEP